MPRTTASAMMMSGIQRMICKSRSTKVPSSSGFISAGSEDSAAAPTTVPRSASANTRQYGLT